MSDKPEIELDLDLQLLPAWARQPQTTHQYADFETGGDRDRRGPRGRGPGGPRRDAGDRRGEGRGPRPEGRGFRGDDRGRPRGDRGRRPDAPRREPQEELPEGVSVELIPDPEGVDSLTRQIRQTGRAYPLFDIGHLILKRPDRYLLEFKVTGNHPDGSPRQLYVCSLDDTLWMNEGEAVRHILARHFDTFYQTEKIPVDPPKGTYTFVAQCGMSGTILGPPNLHDYQSKLQRLHAERFPRVPFDVFKSRVRIVRDEAVVKKWLEEQSFRHEYTALNVPEPVKLSSREAVEQHFRQVHLPNIVRPVTTHTVRSPAARDALPGPLRRLARREFDLQQRFPLKLVTRLSEDFAHRGLHFFKVNKTVLHVAVARPRHLDLETTPVSESIRKIIHTIENTRDCTRRKLLESLGVALPPGEGGASPASEQAEPPSPELQAIITDLHWLIHEGHVVEYANGRLEVARKPAPRPAPAPRQQQQRPAGTQEGSAAEPAQAGTPPAEPGEATQAAPATESAPGTGETAGQSGEEKPVQETGVPGAPTIDAAQGLASAVEALHNQPGGRPETAPASPEDAPPTESSVPEPTESGDLHRGTPVVPTETEGAGAATGADSASTPAAPEARAEQPPQAGEQPQGEDPRINPS